MKWRERERERERERRELKRRKRRLKERKKKEREKEECDKKVDQQRNNVKGLILTVGTYSDGNLFVV